jgi:hypothetical protein
MKRYVYSVLLQVEVEAFSEADAYEAVEDCFGAGSNCGLNVLDFEVVDSDEF